MAFWSEFTFIVAVILPIKAAFNSGFCPSKLFVQCHSRLIVQCSCPPEWQLWENKCYRLSSSTHTWDGAKTACQDMGGRMAAPRSLEEMNFMSTLARQVDSDYSVYIACNDKEVEGTWECDAITAQLRSGSCHSRLTVQCSCPPEWSLWGNECYRLTPSLHNWDDAKTACQDMGGKMAAPCSLEEMNFMVELARNVDSDYYAWIACNDKEEEGIWECDGQEGSEPFLVWDDGEPNNNKGNQDCVRMASYLQERMDDGFCYASYLAFCVRRAACTHSLIQLRH
ncbi:C-type lectin mannose-binding isoform-like [Patiria miniata]|uniref:C-type lectin domain-containing protein n=1 Tax=Patiria miniata TaxID=46514 RepID=A0A914ASZ6_PATMI|nr:C-type lectin mannose-binding isoform-like [Patiria miniata]